MKRFLILLALACASAVQLRAQFFQKAYQELSSTPKAQLINTEETRGRDEQDSLCYLRTYTFTLPYASKAERGKADRLLRQIQLDFYNLSSNTTTHCSVAPFTKTEQMESKPLYHFYMKGEQEFAIGGTGRRYVAMRHHDHDNPSYRTAEGMEWWLDDSLRKAEVKCRLFILHGLMNENLSQRQSISLSSTSTTFDTNLKVLQRLTHWPDQRQETWEVLSVTINKYLIHTLKLNLDDSQRATLFNTFKDVPGYYACIIRNQRDKEYMPLSDLADIYPKLNVFSTTWTERGDAECRKKASETSSPCYFMLQVYLDD